jgi:predicted nucleotidyltransferase component of viral defense system
MNNTDVFDKMLAEHHSNFDDNRSNALYEVTQQIALSGLYRGGFFDKAAFYGGTCLRIIHGLNRYSEDMDFSLLEKDSNFHIEDYFPAIITEFKALGRDVTIKKKDKRNFGKVESAFLKDTTEVYDLSFQTEKKLKIKIEVDIMPPLQFETEQKLLLQPFAFMVRCFTLPDLFAGKMHALVFRNWKNRIKGRDWYDFDWYVRNGVELNFSHLQERIREFNGTEMNYEQFLILLKDKLSTTNIDLVKADVEAFILDPRELEIWSNDYFLMLVDKMKVKK